MDYQNLTSRDWHELDNTGTLVNGYKSNWLSLNPNSESNLHIFRDEFGCYHLAIKAPSLKKKDIEDPGVNGLQIELVKYRFGREEVKQFIDIKCNIEGYIEEFTEVVKEIAQAILKGNEKPEKATKRIINNWLSFWSNQSKTILSAEDQIGLICELILLHKICSLNPEKALSTWSGPLGEKHDFNFSDWTLEIKGTRRKKRIHTINGLEQLEPSENKRLALISFMVSVIDIEKENTMNLPNLIDQIIFNHFRNKPNLVMRFNELLSGIGYNPIHRKDYCKFNLEVNKATLFLVDYKFPKLTSNMINPALDTRVCTINYEISLEDMLGIELKEINWGNYFY